MEGSFNLTTITSNPVIITAPYFANSYFLKCFFIFFNSGLKKGNILEYYI